MSEAFRPSSNAGRWMAHLQQLARITLERVGVTAVYAQEDCTFSRPDKYFSFRRDGVCGRMASLIWLDENG